MTAIYQQHATAFAHVSAYVILHDGQCVATVAFKYPRDGAGRLYAYVHWLGTPMVRGFAGGGGYDKRSAACAAAVRKLGNPNLAVDDASRLWLAFAGALAKDDGHGWDAQLQRAGFDVVQAV